MPTATGDLYGKCNLLQRDIKHIRYPTSLDVVRLSAANGVDFVALLMHALQRYSPHVTTLASQYIFCTKRHSKFLEGVFKLARDEFSIKINMTPSQFMSTGFAERKVMLVHQIITACKEYHSTEARQHRLAALKAVNAARRNALVQQPNLTASVSANTATKQKQVLEPIFSPDCPRALPQFAFNTTNQVYSSQDQQADNEAANILELIKFWSQQSAFNNSTTTDQQHTSVHTPIGQQPQQQQQITTDQQLQEASLQNGEHILALQHHIQQVQQDIDNIKYGLECMRAGLQFLETDTEAHLSVLEKRLVALESKAAKSQTVLTRNMATVPHTFWPLPPAHLPLGVTTTENPMLHQQHSEDIQEKSGGNQQPATTVKQQQAWVRWNSPTACFNPLYNHHQQSQSQAISKTSSCTEEPEQDKQEIPASPARHHLASAPTLPPKFAQAITMKKEKRAKQTRDSAIDVDQLEKECQQPYVNLKIATFVPSPTAAAGAAASDSEAQQQQTPQSAVAAHLYDFFDSCEQEAPGTLEVVNSVHSVCEAAEALLVTYQHHQQE